MEEFIEKLKNTLDIELSTDNLTTEQIPFFLKLDNFKKEFLERKSWIEEFMLSGDYETTKNHLLWIAAESAKLYQDLEELERIEYENCGCIHNITNKELDAYLKSIGGLDNGYGDRYWGNNKIRELLFNITSWILWKLPYYKKSKDFCKNSSVNIFLYNILYWVCKPILKDNKPKNPFRSMIYDCGSFSISSGWNGLVKKLIEEAISKGWDKEICQVKEKFGTLRFYVNSAPKEVHDIISKYEDLSSSICETCGGEAKTRGGGWIRTLCDECFNEK